MNEETLNQEIEFYNKYYITIDTNDNIISGWSDGPFPDKDTSNAICINEQGSYQFRLYPNGEENPPLFNETGLSLYKYENGEIIAKSSVELQIEETLRQNKNISMYQDQAIEESKYNLQYFLENNPLTWIDGQQYTVTQDKQALLTSQMALYMIDPNTALHWNAQGQPCTVWEPQNLAALAKAIEEYVRPYITYQQQKEVEMRACGTVEELDQVIVNYNTLE